MVLMLRTHFTYGDATGVSAYLLSDSISIDLMSMDSSTYRIFLFYALKITIDKHMKHQHEQNSRMMSMGAKKNR